RPQAGWVRTAPRRADADADAWHGHAPRHARIGPPALSCRMGSCSRALYGLRAAANVHAMRHVAWTCGDGSAARAEYAGRSNGTGNGPSGNYRARDRAGGGPFVWTRAPPDLSSPSPLASR